MRILHVLNQLGLGGTEKAALYWSLGATIRGHQASVVALTGGPGSHRFGTWGIEATVVDASVTALADHIRGSRPDLIHAHVPGYAHEGDMLGDALTSVPRRPPVVSTNVFGLLQNPAEDAWTDARLFVSWTSCVQAARRAGVPVEDGFFARQSVVSNPMPPSDTPSGVPGLHRDAMAALAMERRRQLGIPPRAVLIGRFARPDASKWDVPLTRAIRYAVARNEDVWAVLQEVPPRVWRSSWAPHSDRVLRLAASSDEELVAATQAACDVVVHRSNIGESFGYAIAEPMLMGVPVVTSSTPWGDQAQLELVRSGISGLVASSPRTIHAAISSICADPGLRARLGGGALRRVEEIAGFDATTTRLIGTYEDVCGGTFNAHRQRDVALARGAAQDLASQQWGSTRGEAGYLRAMSAVMRSRAGMRRLRRSLQT
jgi:hypothetical protein